MCVCVWLRHLSNEFFIRFGRSSLQINRGWPAGLFDLMDFCECQILFSGRIQIISVFAAIFLKQIMLNITDKVCLNIFLPIATCFLTMFVRFRLL